MYVYYIGFIFTEHYSLCNIERPFLMTVTCVCVYYIGFISIENYSLCNVERPFLNDSHICMCTI